MTSLDSLVVAAMLHRGVHHPDATDDTWQELILWASPRRLLGRSLDVKGVGMLWDDPRFVAAAERRYHVGIPIDAEDIPEVALPAQVMVTLPGTYFTHTVMGPYDRLPAAYDQVLGVEMKIAGLRLAAAPILELYRNSPADTPADELRTDLYLPVVRV